jgi:hypothetical protein
MRLARELRDAGHLERAVETGTWHGKTARALADVFSGVITIELSPELHREASEDLAGARVEVLCGHSPKLLAELDRNVPTLYFLDAHWSAGDTAGDVEQCPVIDEIRAIGSGHPRDCLIIDDARLFLYAPGPPLDPARWPTFTQVFDEIRLHRPEHVITVIADRVIAVPARIKPVLDSYGRSVEPKPPLRYRLPIAKVLDKIGL